MQYFTDLDMKKTASLNTPEQAPTIDLDALAWTYSQKSGELDRDDAKVATGYSGAGTGKNNPEMQHIHNVGPIPQGEWTITGPPVDTKTHGPYVLKLAPNTETETFGRSGFLMHGDSKDHPGTASQGCIIVPKSVREQVWNSGDRDLKVIGDSSKEEKEKV